MASRIPVADACQVHRVDLEQMGFPTPNGTYAVSSWVDNLTSLATCAENACGILDLLCSHLRQYWGLNYKPSSMEVMSVKPLEFEVFDGYLVRRTLDLLGHFISDDGRLDYPWGEVRRRVLSALFSKFKACNVGVLSLEGVADEVNRHLWPIVQFRSNNWPFRKELAEKMDSLQCQCISIASCIAPKDGEDVGEYHRRRAKSAGVGANLSGRWSLKWAKQVCAWNDHNLRNSSGQLWATGIMQVRPSSWLRSVRQQFVPRFSVALNPFTAEAGRLATRARRGGPSRRWEDSVRDAQAYIEVERLTGLLKFATKRKATQKYATKTVQTLSLDQLERFDDIDETAS